MFDWPIVFSWSTSPMFTLAIDGQHHFIAITKPDGQMIATPTTNAEIDLLQKQIETIVARIVARNHGLVDGSFVLRPIVEDMVFTPHGDHMNILMPVEQFSQPVSVRMTFAELAISMRKALAAMGIKPN